MRRKRRQVQSHKGRNIKIINSEDEKEKLKRVDKTKKILPLFDYYFLSSSELQNPLPK